MSGGMSAEAATIRRWREHPSQMVRELFGATPDPWQDDALEAYPHSPRLAMKSAKGPGKSTTLAWIGWNFLLTRPHPKCAVTSISGDNLQDGLWAEMSKWQQKSRLLQHLFEWTKTRIFCKEHPETWFMSARTWSQTADASRQAETLAGIHADYVLFLIDESGAMPDAIMPTAEAILSGCVEAHIVQAGNPNQLAGPLYRACTIARDLWKVIEITGDPDNPKRSPRIPVEYARQQIQQYGRDNPWIKINIFGEFPPSALNALIGPDEVRAAMNRYYRDYELRGSSKVMGVDVARQGDDQSIVAKRQGLQFFPLLKYRNIDGLQGAGHVSREWQDWEADGCFVDATGGFGYTWIDQLRNLGRSPIPVEFAGEAVQKSRYYNKRAEMAFEFVEAIKRGAALPNDDHLLQALTQTTYTFKGDRFLLEPKDDVKAKLGFSPDEMDACMLTYAQPISVTANARSRPRSAIPQDYDPFAHTESGQYNR